MREREERDVIIIHAFYFNKNSEKFILIKFRRYT